MESSVNKNRQLKLDSLVNTQPVKTGESVSYVSRATKTGDRPSCYDTHIEHVSNKACMQLVDYKISLLQKVFQLLLRSLTCN